MANSDPPPGCSDPVDPLSQYSLISLFPKTFGILSAAPEPYDLHGDLDSLQDRLLSIALRSPNKLLQQAKAIVEKKSEILNGKLSTNVTSLEVAIQTDEVSDNNGITKRRREGLGLKRPRFSLKPDFGSQPAPNLEFNVDKYKDPDEFFAAFERFENAKREIDRLAGVVPDQKQYSSAGNARPRRPGISRKPASYKHLFNETSVSSQEISQKDDIGTESLFPSSQPEEIDSSNQIESAGPLGAEKEVSELFDGLFSSIFGGLDRDDAVNLLEEHLQIKTFNIKSLHLPEMQAIKCNEVRTSGSDLSKSRHVLSDIHNILKRTHNKSPLKHGLVLRSPGTNVLSPTPPKSPFAPMSLLRKHLFGANSTVDPFSPHNLDDTVMQSSRPTKHLETRSPNVKRINSSGLAEKSKSPINKEVGDELHNLPQVQCASHFADKDASNFFGDNESDLNIGLSQKNVDKDEKIASLPANKDVGSCSSKEEFDANTGLSEKNVDNEDNMETQPADTCAGNSSNMEECDINIALSQKNVLSEHESLSAEAEMLFESQCNPTVNSSDHLEKEGVSYAHMDNEMQTLAFGGGLEGVGPSKNSEKSPRHIKEKEHKSSAKPRKCKQVSGRGRKRREDCKRQTSAAPQNHDLTEGTVTGKSHANPDEHAEVMQVDPKESLVDQNKEEAHVRMVRLRKELNRRQSLAAAGTSWNCGVRRSTRIKSRPLEYWRGERFLYGRVHQSLATVIGIKYVSPGKVDGKPSFRVKSYVSDEYKDLVDLVSLH